MAKFEYGEFSAEFDPTDVEYVEKYEKAAKEYNERIKKIPKTGYESEKIRYICKLIFDFFDYVFGEGTHKRMFGDKISGAKCIDAFKKLIADMRTDDVGSLLQEVSENRSTRRASAKAKAIKK